MDTSLLKVVGSRSLQLLLNNYCWVKKERRLISNKFVKRNQL